jgi:hypothetical protein
MNIESDQLEQIWDNLLSRQPNLIQAAFSSLDSINQKAVLAHLYRMVDETGWQPEQRASARAAIKVLGSQSNQDK